MVAIHDGAVQRRSPAMSHVAELLRGLLRRPRSMDELRRAGFDRRRLLDGIGQLADAGHTVHVSVDVVWMDIPLPLTTASEVL